MARFNHSGRGEGDTRAAQSLVSNRRQSSTRGRSPIDPRRRGRFGKRIEILGCRFKLTAFIRKFQTK
jgi:hypothetical protein